MRKKTSEKNQDLHRDISKKGEFVKELEEQIASLKKRINDLSILKSSNNTILNQKVSQLTEENRKLKRNIDILQKKGMIT